MDDDEQYRERMRRKKAAMDRRIAAAANDKGLLLALTGAGLGKSTSAYGMAARAMGHGLHCAIARLGPGGTGELTFFAPFPGMAIRSREPAEADAASVSADWIESNLHHDEVDLVILDELDQALADGLIDADRLGAALDGRPSLQHVVVTGRSLPEAILERADTITELRDAKNVLDRVDRGEVEDATAAAWLESDRLDTPHGQGRALVHTGNGKGKSSAAFGKVARALGHGRNIGIVQFIKGRFTTGERECFDGHARVRYRVMGQGFTWETQDRSQDQERADEAWKEARAMLSDPALELVLLDEMNNAIKKGYVDLDEAVAAVQARPAHQDVIITGRNARPALMAAADAATQVHKQRHAFDNGYRAQQGIDL
jgi:cob(I)alamin adenosyltransferase